MDDGVPGRQGDKDGEKDGDGGSKDGDENDINHLSSTRDMHSPLRN
jgi:hypothetical protein